MALTQPGFSNNTHPNLFTNPYFGTEYKTVQQITKDVSPARDSRYPAYSGLMDDGRFVTDYRPKCTKNVQPQNQFNTKLWMINHATDMINESRKRQVEWTGASLSMANTVPPPADIVHSTKFYSEVNSTGLCGGIGVERADCKAPTLFGTFQFEPTMTEIRNNRKNTGITTYYEGGRNSKR